MTFLEVLTALNDMYVRIGDEANWIHNLKGDLLTIAYNPDMPQPEKDRESARLVEDVMRSLHASNDALHQNIHGVLDAAETEEGYVAAEAKS